MDIILGHDENLIRFSGDLHNRAKYVKFKCMWWAGIHLFPLKTILFHSI